MRATPPLRRMSAGTRSRAMTATAPASSAMRASSAVTTSMMTPPAVNSVTNGGKLGVELAGWIRCGRPPAVVGRMLSARLDPRPLQPRCQLLPKASKPTAHP